MKSTGIVRRIDDLGRIVLPIEIRKILEIEPKDSLEIFIDDDKIVLKKYAPQCIFCGNSDQISMFRGRNVCRNCAGDISRNMGFN